MANNKDCIDNVQEILNDLGLRSNTRISDQKLRAIVEPKTGVRYTVYFLEQNNRILIEAIVAKSVSGKNQRHLALFHETLLTYNSSVFPFSFAITKVKDGFLNIILRYSPSCTQIDANELKYSVEALNEAFCMHIPKIKELAEDSDLKFTGHDEFRVTDIVKNVLGI